MRKSTTISIVFLQTSASPECFVKVEVNLSVKNVLHTSTTMKGLSETFIIEHNGLISRCPSHMGIRVRKIPLPGILTKPMLTSLYSLIPSCFSLLLKLQIIYLEFTVRMSSKNLKEPFHDRCYTEIYSTNTETAAIIIILSKKRHEVGTKRSIRGTILPGIPTKNYSHHSFDERSNFRNISAI